MIRNEIDPKGVVATSVSTLAKERPEEPNFKFDAKAIVASPAFWPGVAIFAALTLAFWPLVRQLPGLWLGDEYYTHGFLIPPIIAYVIYRWWPRISSTPVKPAILPVFGMAFGLFIGYVGIMNDMDSVTAVGLVATMIASIGFVAGWRWMGHLSLPTAFFSFALPIFGPIVDGYTNPLQVISAKAAVALLKVIGYDPIVEGGTTVYLPTYTLDVGAPCSGLKLLIALSAFTIFFVMISGLRWWGNLLLLLIVFPLSVLINGLRIALIGVVGNMWGEDAGHKFHDYSGYIVLVVCFVILFYFAKLLGWKK